MRTSSRTEAPGCVLQSSMTCRSPAAGALPVTLYQPKTLLKRAPPRLTTVKVSAQVGWKVSGVVCASAAGSRPESIDGMQPLSLTACHIVVSQVPCLPSSQVVEPPGQGAPMLQTPAVVHWQAKTAPRPVGCPDAQPGAEGIDVPFGCVSARLSDGNARVASKQDSVET